ncbi:TlpA disulfide reductase family protein [Maribacter sp. Asnod1-A12]|uniref:TlpA disulfide reductase family protein n=1 Tax=Maribacter sp. Asnod1-A12 TaxID=3160576 RepID=UPI0038676BDF
MQVQRSFLVVILSLLVFSFSKDNTFERYDLDIPVYNFDSLEPLLYTDDDTIHIINFWAMWCAPCIKELPILEEYQKNNPESKVILVSLDFPEDIETKLKPFLKRKGISSKVVLLDDPDANSWIDKVDPNWSGAIPFTIIFNKEKRTYHERAFSNMEDFKNAIHKSINN